MLLKTVTPLPCWNLTSIPWFLALVTVLFLIIVLGDLDAGDTGSGQQSQEGKAYEIVPPVTTSKELTNTSGLIVLCIASIMGLLIYGYRRGYDNDEF